MKQGPENKNADGSFWCEHSYTRKRWHIWKCKKPEACPYSDRCMTDGYGPCLIDMPEEYGNEVIE